MIEFAAHIISCSKHAQKMQEPSLSRPNEMEDPTTFSASTSEDMALDTPSSSDDNYPESRENGMGQIHQADSVTEETPPRSITEPMVNGKHSDRSTASSHKASVLPYPLGRQLSAVQEVRTPSPGQERGHLSSLSVSSMKSPSRVNQSKPKLADALVSDSVTANGSPQPSLPSSERRDEAAGVSYHDRGASRAGVVRLHTA